jgi:hypothetical protein
VKGRKEGEVVKNKKEEKKNNRGWKEGILYEHIGCEEKEAHKRRGEKIQISKNRIDNIPNNNIRYSNQNKMV